MITWLERLKEEDPGERLIVRYVLKGPQGAAQFVYMRPIIEAYPEAEREEKLAKHPPPTEVFAGMRIPDFMRDPMPVDLGVHQPDVHAPGILFESCAYFEGPCRYEGSGIAAKPYLDLLLDNGEEALWQALEEFYIERFGGAHERDDEEAGPSRAG